MGFAAWDWIMEVLLTTAKRGLGGIKQAVYTQGTELRWSFLKSYANGLIPKKRTSSISKSFSILDSK